MLYEIKANDCGFITYNYARNYGRQVHDDVMNLFLSSIDESVIPLTNKARQDKSPLAEFRRGVVAGAGKSQYGWFAGRYIGEAVFYDEGEKPYKICISPRFGHAVLNHMIAEISNIKFTSSKQRQDKDNNDFFMKKIIAILWLRKISDANKHGLPRIKFKHMHQSHMIKGVLDIQKSLIPLRIKKEVISHSREKMINPVIASILYQTYQYLKEDIAKSNQSDAMINATSHISKISPHMHVSNSDYKDIKYNAIDYVWKDVVDFSWGILKNKKLSLQMDVSKKNGYGIFLDMAEIWKEYIKAILRKNLSGWQLWNDKDCCINAYKNTFFRRKMIPDIILERDGQLMIFDAKYKAMTGSYWDVDRGDFFQAHTYIQYLQNFKQAKIVVGGLLYPLVTEISDNMATSLFGLKNDDTNFIIDGIEIDNENLINAKDDEKIKMLQEFEQKFIHRIHGLILSNDGGKKLTWWVQDK